jgi:hypothetical protein
MYRINKEMSPYTIPLKCAMAGAYGKYYEEIFGTHFYQTL